jgi:hypothetical protein
MRPNDWNRKLDAPIPLPKGKPLATLRDAALYITKLPKAEHDADEWQAAMQVLLLIAEHGGSGGALGAGLFYFDAIVVDARHGRIIVFLAAVGPCQSSSPFT